MLFTVPSRYWFTIGRLQYLALGRGRPCFPPDVSCPAVLTFTMHSSPRVVAYGALTRSGAPSQGTSARFALTRPWLLQPRGTRVPRFRLVPFRSPLLRESRLISLPPGTEMFQFPGFASLETSDDGARAPPGCPIRPSRDHCLCAAPPSFSQLTAAFLASVCPGIPHMPSLA